MASTLFDGVPEAGVRLALPYFRKREYEANAMIVRRGDDGTEMFLVHTGTVAIRVDRRLVARLGPGDTFGEVCLLDGGKRSASVIAVDAVTVLVLDRPALLKVIQDQPVLAARMLLNLVRLLGAKLRRADALIEEQAAKEREAEAAAGRSATGQIARKIREWTS